MPLLDGIRTFFAGFAHVVLAILVSTGSFDGRSGKITWQAFLVPGLLFVSIAVSLGVFLRAIRILSEVAA